MSRLHTGTVSPLIRDKGASWSARSPTSWNGTLTAEDTPGGG
ncbi:hypothetical protein ABR738_32870 [Streptomyces sp. Edi4]